MLLTIVSATSFGQKEKRYAREGNSMYKEGKYSDAEIEYKRALEKNPLATGVMYNLGNTLYKQNKPEEALKTVMPIVDSIKTSDEKSNLFHNIGNYNLSQKKYQEAVDAYKNSLRIRPYDKETKSNLAYAQKMLKNEQNKQNQQNQQNNQNDKDNKDKNKDNKNDQNKNDQKKDDQSKQNQQPDINKQSAEQMLQALQNKENQTQDKVNKEKVKALVRNQPEKNW